MAASQPARRWLSTPGRLFLFRFGLNLIDQSRRQMRARLMEDVDSSVLEEERSSTREVDHRPSTGPSLQEVRSAFLGEPSNMPITDRQEVDGQLYWEEDAHHCTSTTSFTARRATI
jgi:hypothetical protein